jgi:hypothetical protein
MQSEWVKIMGPAQSWRMAHMAPYYATHGLLSLTTLAASLAILFRKSWGLKLFSAVLVGLIFIHLWNLGFNLSGFFTMPDKMILGGVSFPRGLMIFSWGMGAAISLFFLVLYGWLLKNFRGKEVKNMFYKSGGKDEK